MAKFLRALLHCALTGAVFFLLWYTHSQVYYVGYEKGISAAVKEFNRS
jgi:hypothetical protein